MGIVWSEKAGAVLSIRHTHPLGMGKTPASCRGLIKKRKLSSQDESERSGWVVLKKRVSPERSGGHQFCQIFFSSQIIRLEKSVILIIFHLN